MKPAKIVAVALTPELVPCFETFSVQDGNLYIEEQTFKQIVQCFNAAAAEERLPAFSTARAAKRKVRP